MHLSLEASLKENQVTVIPGEFFCCLCSFVTGRNEVVAKVMFLHVSVILLTGGVLRRTPPPDQADPPLGPRRPPQTKENPPRTRQTPPDQGKPTHPPRRTKENPPKPGRTPLPPDQGEPPLPPPPGTKENPPDQGEPPPPREEHCSIRSMSGRYASYWNAFLFCFSFFNVNESFSAKIKFQPGHLDYELMR